MHRRFLGAGLALAALLVGQQATQPQPVSPGQQAKLIEGMDHSIEQAKPHQPAPAKPAAPAAAQRQVALEARSLSMDLPTRYFIEQPQRRKVKRSKYSWVII